MLAEHDLHSANNNGGNSGYGFASGWDHMAAQGDESHSGGAGGAAGGGASDAGAGVGGTDVEWDTLWQTDTVGDGSLAVVSEAEVETDDDDTGLDQQELWRRQRLRAQAVRRAQQQAGAIPAPFIAKKGSSSRRRARRSVVLASRSAATPLDELPVNVAERSSVNPFRQADGPLSPSAALGGTHSDGEQHQQATPAPTRASDVFAGTHTNGVAATAAAVELMQAPTESRSYGQPDTPLPFSVTHKKESFAHGSASSDAVLDNDTLTAVSGDAGHNLGTHPSAQQHNNQTDGPSPVPGTTGSDSSDSGGTDSSNTDAEQAASAAAPVPGAEAAAKVEAVTEAETEAEGWTETGTLPPRVDYTSNDDIAASPLPRVRVLAAVNVARLRSRCMQGRSVPNHLVPVFAAVLHACEHQCC